MAQVSCNNSGVYDGYYLYGVCKSLQERMTTLEYALKHQEERFEYLLKYLDVSFRVTPAKHEFVPTKECKPE